MEQNQKIEVTQGGDNVFADLGFSAEEAVHLKIRTDLMLDLKKYIQKQGWSEAEAAVFFEEPSLDISHLLNGNVTYFSIDKLITMLAKAGMQVKIEVSSEAA